MHSNLAAFCYTNKKHLWLGFILHLNLVVNNKYDLDLAIFSEWVFCIHTSQVNSSKSSEYKLCSCGKLQNYVQVLVHATRSHALVSVFW